MIASSSVPRSLPGYTSVVIMCAPPLSFQPHQAHTAWPMTSSLSRSDNQGSSSVNIVTHCRHEHGIFVMSVPQNMRAGPKAS